MGHRGLGVTASQARYENKYQGAPLPRLSKRTSPPPLERPTDEDQNSMAWVEYARAVSVRLAGKVGGFEMQRFWALIPDELTARADAEIAERILALLETHSDFDKALAAFREERHG
jgi:hypothetical protein